MRPNYRRVFYTAGLLSLVLCYSLVWFRMITSQAERTGSDFISAYAAGRVASVRGGANVYNLDNQQEVQAQVVGFDLAPGQVLMFNHPPYLVPLLSLLMDENYIASLIRYFSVMVVLYILALIVLYRLLRSQGWERVPARLALAGMATFYPLFISLVNTQDTALLVLGGCLWLAGLRRRQDWLAGVGLALTTVRPQLALFLAVPFLFRRGGIFKWFSLSVGILAGIGLLAVGIRGFGSYVQILLTAAGGTSFGMHESDMVSLIGLITRLFPNGSNIIHWVGWSLFFAALAAFCVVLRRARQLEDAHIILLVVSALFFSPHLHYHDLALLLVTFAVALPSLTQAGVIRSRDGGLVIIGCSYVLLLGWSVAFLRFNLPFLVMLGLVLTPFLPLKLPPRGPNGKEEI